VVTSHCPAAGDDVSTKQTLRDMEEWGKTASDRDIQFHRLRVAVETRDKVETIRSSVTFLFVLWLIGVVVATAAAASSQLAQYGPPPWRSRR